MAGLPHQRIAPAPRHMIEQGAARLYIGDDRGALPVFQSVLRIDHQQLIAPNHPAFTIDRADPVAVAVESHSEIEVLLGDERAQIRQIRLDRRIGMMIGKSAVDIGEKKVVLARQLRGEHFERGSGSAIARVPADLEIRERSRVDIAKAHQQALDILAQNLAALDAARAFVPVARRGHFAQFLDIRAEKRTALKDHLEAVVIGGIVAAGYLNAAIHILA